MCATHISLPYPETVNRVGENLIQLYFRQGLKYRIDKELQKFSTKETKLLTSK